MENCTSEHFRFSLNIIFFEDLWQEYMNSATPEEIAKMSYDPSQKESKKNKKEESKPQESTKTETVPTEPKNSEENHQESTNPHRVKLEINPKPVFRCTGKRQVIYLFIPSYLPRANTNILLRWLALILEVEFIKSLDGKSTLGNTIWIFSQVLNLQI